MRLDVCDRYRANAASRALDTVPSLEANFVCGLDFRIQSMFSFLCLQMATGNNLLHTGIPEKKTSSSSAVFLNGELDLTERDGTTLQRSGSSFDRRVKFIYSIFNSFVNRF